MYLNKKKIVQHLVPEGKKYSFLFYLPMTTVTLLSLRNLFWIEKCILIPQLRPMELPRTVAWNLQLFWGQKPGRILGLSGPIRAIGDIAPWTLHLCRMGYGKGYPDSDKSLLF